MANLRANDELEKKRNKLKEGRRRRARQRKEAQDTYKMELAEYYKRRSEKEAEETRTARIHESLTTRYGNH
jgi:AICAR transformylase/IMP cyclohydrolase PurH